MRALRVDTDGTITELDLSADEDYLTAIQEATGGWVEHHTIGKNMLLWLDEDAPAKGASPNMPVNHMVSRSLGVYLNGAAHGPAVISGGANGAARSLTDEAAELVHANITARTDV